MNFRFLFWVWLLVLASFPVFANYPPSGGSFKGCVHDYADAVAKGWCPTSVQCNLRTDDTKCYSGNYNNQALFRVTDLNCNPGDTYSVEANACIPRQATPQECNETNQVWLNGSCVNECPGAVLNNICLNEPDNNCDFDSPDLVAVSGGVPICSPESQCPGGSQGLFNGELVCLPPADDLPTCEAGSITIISEGGGGYVCASPSGSDPENPNSNPTPEGGNSGPLVDDDGNAVTNTGEPGQNSASSNSTTTTTGTDGNGNPYSETSQTQNNDINTAKIELNTRRTELNTARSNELLQQIVDNTSNQPEPCDPLTETCPADMDDLLDHLNERAIIPDELGLAPTFSDTTTYFKTSLNNAPIISAFSNAPSIASFMTCPIFSGEVYLLGNVVFDIHCTILEDHRSQLSLIFIAMWTLSAALVFLRA